MSSKRGQRLTVTETITDTDTGETTERVVLDYHGPYGEPIPPDVLERLRLYVLSLPEDERQALRQAWEAAAGP